MPSSFDQEAQDNNGPMPKVFGNYARYQKTQ